MSNTAVSELAWGALASPVGEMSVACTAAGWLGSSFGAPPTRRRGRGVGACPAERVSGGAPGEAAGHPAAALAQVMEYFVVTSGAA